MDTFNDNRVYRKHNLIFTKHLTYQSSLVLKLLKMEKKRKILYNIIKYLSKNDQKEI